MPKLTIEITTDENGYFSGTVSFEPGSLGRMPCLTVTLLSPFATGLWATLDVDTREGEPSRTQRAFVAWHSESVQLGSWRLDERANVIVVTGKTKPARARDRLLLEIDVAT